MVTASDTIQTQKHINGMDIEKKKIQNLKISGAV